MKNIIVTIIWILLPLTLRTQTIEEVDSSMISIVTLQDNSLITKLIDTITQRDADCIRVESNMIRINCITQTEENDTTYFLRVMNGVCFLDASDTLLLGISYYKGKKILWYNTFPENLSCHKEDDKVWVQSQMDCPIDDLIPETYCLYYYGVLSICKRKNCKIEEDTIYTQPIIIE